MSREFRAASPSTPPRAFTLVELLVVIGIIALLIAILLPTLGRARRQATTLQCLSNMRQLGAGFMMYAADNKGYIISADTVGDVYWFGVSKFYGWVDGNNTKLSMTGGAMYKYVKTMAVYRCPDDDNVARLRSYSENGYFNTIDAAITPSMKVVRLSQVARSADCIAFAEEPDPRMDWNLNGFYQPPFESDPTSPTRWLLTDVVGKWHRGANFTFADGHGETWIWKDKRTGTPIINNVMPNNPDVDRIRRAMVTWGKNH